MSRVRWEPVPMNRLITSLFDTPTPTQAVPAARRFAPATDLIETESDYVLRADLPGVSENDVHVELDGNLLTISGERRSESESRDAGYHRVERAFGSFRRSLRLPDGVNADAITARFERGVLEVTVPKPQSATPRRISVMSGDSAAPAGGEVAPTIEASEVSDPSVTTEASAEPAAA